MASCTSLSPLSFFSLHHLLSSPLADPLIIGPWNEAKRCRRAKKKKEKPSLLFVPLDDDISASRRFICARTSKLRSLMFPLIIAHVYSPFWFDVSKFPPHHLPITKIHLACVLLRQRWKVVEEEEEWKRENWGWWVKNTGWVRAWGWWLWWNVKWCSEGFFCSLPHH